MTVQNTNISKISPPCTTKVLYRTRLFELLDHALKFPVTWISAPAGFGKTTLAASYFEKRKYNCLWYQMDERDMDPATFFYHMGKALNRVDPQEDPLPMLTREYLPNLDTYSINYFENLFGCLTPPCIIVLDDFHLLSDDSTTQNLIFEGLRQIPNGIHVFIISRTDPCTAGASFLARQQMACIAREQISLTRDETGAIIELHDIGKLQPDAVDRLHQITKGWTAGMILIMQQQKISGTSRLNIADYPLEGIFDYLAWEIFQKQNSRVKRLLQSTSFFEAFSPEMAQRLTGVADTEVILAKLYKENCFVGRRYEAGWIYHYHPIFNQFLQHQAHQTLAPTQIQHLKIKTATISMDAGQYESAAALCRQAKAWAHLIRLIHMLSPKLLEQGRYQILTEWIQALPPHLVKRDPRLSNLMGLCTISFDPVKARKWFEQAHNEFVAGKDAEGVYLNWSCLVETHIHMRNSFIPLDDLIHAADEIVAQFPSFPSRQAEYRFVLGIISALVFRQPTHSQFSKWEQEANRLFHDAIDISQKVMLANFLVLHYCKMAQLPKAAVIVSTIKRHLKTRKVSPLVQIVWRCVASLFLWATGEIEEALDTVKTGLEISKTSGIDIWNPVLLSFAACACLGSGDSKSANKYLNKMSKTLLSAGIFDIANYHYISAWNALLQNDLALAHENAKIALSLNEKAGDPFNIGRSHLGLAQIGFAMNAPILAFEHLDHALEANHKIGSDVLYSGYFMIQAGYYFSCGDEEKALVSLDNALARAKKKQILFIDWIRPEVISKLCMKALEAGIETDYVKKIIRKLNLVINPPEVTCEYWPWPLRICTLGKFTVRSEDKKLNFKIKGKAKPLEMLKAIIALGAIEVRKEQLEDILWPDADGDTANQSFTVTLHRLRRLLGIKDAVLLQEAKVSLNPNSCWLDVWAFEALLAKAQTRRNDADIENGLLLQQKAVDLYMGDFLADDTDYLWSYNLRERIRSKYMRCVEKLGTRFLSEGSADKAIDCFRKALEVDPLAERIYKQLMLTYKKLGHTVDAIAVYQQCQKAFAMAPDIKPSRGTKAIYESLMTG